jgi:hypothetical protein
MASIFLSSIFLVERVFGVQVALLGVSNINVQDGEGSSALHIATEGNTQRGGPC